MGFIWFLIIGGLAGWLAGLIMKGRGFGLFGNIIYGHIFFRHGIPHRKSLGCTRCYFNRL